MKNITFTLLTFFAVSLFAQQGFEYRGVDVKVTRDGKTVHYLVKRERDPVCRKLRQSNEILWGGNYAAEKVPDACKSVFLKTAGKLSPIKLDDEIETYGELEVLAFLKEMQTDKNKVLIDARKEPWFAYRTIPGAVNMPFYYFRDREHYPDEFAYALKYLGGKLEKDGTFSFEHPKTIVVFCNGPWCSLSRQFIDAITDAGFPHEHIKWYRDGMQGWLLANFTSTRPVSAKPKRK